MVSDKTPAWYMLPMSTNVPTDIIIGAVCEHYRVSREDLLGRSRFQPVVWARQVAMAEVALRRGAGGFSHTGREFGRNHATVVHAIRVVVNAEDCYRKVREDLAKLRHEIDERGNQP